jgi:biopolymer transport protein ExbB/TolQ
MSIGRTRTHRVLLGFLFGTLAGLPSGLYSIAEGGTVGDLALSCIVTGLAMALLAMTIGSRFISWLLKVFSEIPW